MERKKDFVTTTMYELDVFCLCINLQIETMNLILNSISLNYVNSKITGHAY